MTTQDEFQLLTILRGHDYPVVALEYFYIPTIIDNSVRTPTLLTCDEKGFMIWWDIMVQRRPILKLRVHHQSVLSIKQMGIHWIPFQDTTLNSDRKPTFSDRFSQSNTKHLDRFLITHSRDNLLKIWDMFSIYEKVQVGQTDFTPVHQENINSVNFCNIDVFNDQLVCLNTLNAEFFDIWEIKYQQLDNNKYTIKLEKRFESIDTSILLKQQKKLTNKDLPQISGSFDTILPKKSQLGIIMKLKYLNENILLIGFENGWTLGLHIPPNNKSLAYIDDSKLLQIENMLNIDNLKDTLAQLTNKGNGQNDQQSQNNQFAHILYGDTTSESGIFILKIDTVHYPNPILDICYDGVHDIVITSSVGSKIAIFSSKQFIASDNSKSIQNYMLSHEAKELKSIGVSSLDIRLDGLIGMNFWNGLVKFYKFEFGTDNKQKIQIVKTNVNIEKKKSSVTKEFSSNPHDPEILRNEKQIKRYKSNCLKFSKVQYVNPHVNLRQLVTSSGSSSSFGKTSNLSLMSLKRELKSFTEYNFASVGYDDGSVELYNISLMK